MLAFIRKKENKMTIKTYGAIIIDEKTKSVLCVKPYRNSPWDFPKGQQDKEEEESLDTAKREVREETGLICNEDYKFNGEEVSTDVYGSGRRRKVATYFIATTLKDRDQITVDLTKAIVKDKKGNTVYKKDGSGPLLENEVYGWIDFEKVKEAFSGIERLKPVINFLVEKLESLKDNDSPATSLEEYQESKKLKDVYSFVKD